MSEKEKMLSGQLYDAYYDKELADERMHCKCLCHKYNNLSPDNTEERKALLKKIFGLNLILDVITDIILKLVKIFIPSTIV